VSGADEIFELANDLGKASPKVASALFATFKAAGEDFAKDWQANARETAGAHAKEYPGYIDSETRVGFGIEVETGPRAEGQGMLGRILEFGTATSGAHLDGLRALGPADAKLTRLTENALDGVIP
jgi:hypothetical protein